MGAVLTPYEADPALIIDADTVLSLAIPFEGFQPISRRRPKVTQSTRIVDHIEFPTCHVGDGTQVPCRLIPSEKRLSGLALEALDHVDM
jgi:hypothetical protein